MDGIILVFLETYSVDIAFFVLAGLCLVCALFAVTMRPVKFVSVQNTGKIIGHCTDSNVSWVRQIGGIKCRLQKTEISCLCYVCGHHEAVKYVPIQNTGKLIGYHMAGKLKYCLETSQGS